MIPWLLTLAVAPAVFWMWWFYRKDRFDPEPRGLVLKIFLLGMLPVLPAGVLDRMERGDRTSDAPHPVVQRTP